MPAMSRPRSRRSPRSSSLAWTRRWTNPSTSRARSRPRSGAGVPQSRTHAWPTSATRKCLPRHGGPTWRPLRRAAAPALGLDLHEGPKFPRYAVCRRPCRPRRGQHHAREHASRVADHGEVPPDSVRAHYADAQQALDRLHLLGSTTTKPCRASKTRQRPSSMRAGKNSVHGWPTSWGLDQAARADEKLLRPANMTTRGSNSRGKRRLTLPSTVKSGRARQAMVLP
jgi:hypothetical protein